MVRYVRCITCSIVVLVPISNTPIGLHQRSQKLFYLKSSEEQKKAIALRISRTPRISYLLFSSKCDEYHPEYLGFLPFLSKDEFSVFLFALSVVKFIGKDNTMLIFFMRAFV